VTASVSWTAIWRAVTSQGIKVQERQHEGAPADHDLHALVASCGDRLALLVADLGAARTGDDQRLIGTGHVIAPGDEREQQDEDDCAGDHQERG